MFLCVHSRIGSFFNEVTDSVFSLQQSPVSWFVTQPVKSIRPLTLSTCFPFLTAWGLEGLLLGRGWLKMDPLTTTIMRRERNIVAWPILADDRLRLCWSRSGRLFIFHVKIWFRQRLQTFFDVRKTSNQTILCQILSYDVYNNINLNYFVHALF